MVCFSDHVFRTAAAASSVQNECILSTESKFCNSKQPPSFPFSPCVWPACSASCKVDAIANIRCKLLWNYLCWPWYRLRESIVDFFCFVELKNFVSKIKGHWVKKKQNIIMYHSHQQNSRFLKNCWFIKFSTMNYIFYLAILKFDIIFFIFFMQNRTWYVNLLIVFKSYQLSWYEKFSIILGRCKYLWKSCPSALAEVEKGQTNKN